MNSSAGKTRASISWDGTMLVFGVTQSGVEGMSDIFYTTRDKIAGP